MSDTRGALASELEKVTTIRRRFQAQMPWLQWPIPSGPADPEEEESNPICTKSLELNSEALRVLLKHCDGGFCDIDWLVMEVCVFVHVFGCVSQKDKHQIDRFNMYKLNLSNGCPEDSLWVSVNIVRGHPLFYDIVYPIQNLTRAGESLVQAGWLQKWHKQCLCECLGS